MNICNGNDPLDWTCSHCMAEPGEPCHWAQHNPIELYHAERLEAAAAHAGDGSGAASYTPSVQQFDRAVEASGLF